MKRSNKRIAAGALALALVFGGASVPAASEAGLNFDIAASAADSLANVKQVRSSDIKIAEGKIIDNEKIGKVIFPKNFIVGSGKCGNNLTWTLNIVGTLTISGTGKMTDYNWCNSPWAYNRNVKKLIINKGVTSIGTCAFYHCENLTSITIPDGVTSLGTYAFSGCKSLKYFALPKSVTTIGNGVFSDCDSLTDVTIPGSVTFMGDGVFAWCDNIKSATFFKCLGGLQDTTNDPDSDTFRGGRDFKWCDNTKIATISISFEGLPRTTFEGCTSLTSVTVPENYTYIDYGAFRGCTALRSINIPDGMKTIDADAFSGCTNLKKITLPKSVTYIGNGAFDNCPNLTIYCYKGTAAETYAKNNKIPYELIDKDTGVTITIHDWEEEEREDNGEWSLT